jgi:DNA polymerase IV
MGIATIADLAATAPARLSERFGPRNGPRLRRRACFVDDSPVADARVAVSESRETTFPHDLSDRAELERILERLAGELCAGLARHGRRGRTIGIKVRLEDFRTVTRARTLPAATGDPARVAGVARELLREYAPSRPVRLLGVRVAGFEGEPGAPVEQLALPIA